MKNNKNFNEIIEELNEISNKLDVDELDIEVSLEYFTKGVELIKIAQDKLTNVENKIEILKEENEEFFLEDLE